MMYPFLAVPPTLFQLKQFGQVYGGLKRVLPVGDSDQLSQTLNICGFAQVLLL